jgi:hypothetical protein|tara:strand:- start:1393 stop:1659 length:267 start_codon:yes stop_codon:yes gene_type:complete
MGDALKPQCRSDGFIAKVEFDLWVASTENERDPLLTHKAFRQVDTGDTGIQVDINLPLCKGRVQEPAVFSDAANHVLIDKSDPSQEQV